MDINELVIYRNLEHQELSEEMACLMGYTPRKEKPDTSYYGGGLAGLTVNYSSGGDLWHCFLAFYLANNGNAYTTTCEITGAAGGFLDKLARKNLGIFKALFDYDILKFKPFGMWRQLSVYRPAKRGNRVFSKHIRDCIVNLATQLEESGDVKEFQSHVTESYREFGMGKFGLGKAFRTVEKDEGQTVLTDLIISVGRVYFKDIVGYELQKQKLIRNTEAFVEGREASNVLLFGDADTGKSSNVKAVLSEYYSRELRIIEIYKHRFRMLPDALEQIKNGNYKFIIYMDDLSFEDYELEYGYLKAILEGGLGKWPDNVLVYATSSRYYLIREKFSNERKLDSGLHNSDTVQEKLPLTSRFGVTIYFDSPDRRQFETIVKALADYCHLDVSEDELYREVNRWELNHGGLSGRTASQPMTRLLGRQRIDQY